LALVHHLVARQGYSFDVVARALSLYSKRNLIVEFIPREDRHVSTWSVAEADWYSSSEFVLAMKPYFELIETLPSSPSPRTIMHFARVA
jgi:hypothetical protein